MRITGIIVEYNPFHNGHLLHLKETINKTKCDCVIAVMSGNFVQRGEPAFVNKWARTEMALEAGVDLVLELPLIYSISSAEGFAYGAVATLNKLGVVDSLCFGSEAGSIEELHAVSQILVNEPPTYKVALKKFLKSGLSFPVARQNALMEYVSTNEFENLSPEVIMSIISTSNNILSIEYMKALIRLSSQIKPFTIKRVSNSYNDNKLTGQISSATAIRSNFLNTSSIEGTLPSTSLDIIKKEERSGRGPVELKNFSDILLYKIRQSEIGYLRNILDVKEGLENKIKEAAENSRSLEELISNIKNKRYTSTRIQRILSYILLNITVDDYKETQSPPSYIRILGFNQKGKELIRTIKDRCDIPIVTNPSKADLGLMKKDVDGTDIYVLGYSNTEFKQARQDLKTPPVIKAFP
jgi:predicted nucleotidyltransferase